MVPKREWVRRWVQLREQLSAQVDFDRYFAEGEVGGHAVSVLRAGLCRCPAESCWWATRLAGCKTAASCPILSQRRSATIRWSCRWRRQTMAARSTPRPGCALTTAGRFRLSRR